MNAIVDWENGDGNGGDGYISHSGVNDDVVNFTASALSINDTYYKLGRDSWLEQLSHLRQLELQSPPCYLEYYSTNSSLSFGNEQTQQSNVRHNDSPDKAQRIADQLECMEVVPIHEVKEDDDENELWATSIHSSNGLTELESSSMLTKQQHLPTIFEMGYNRFGILEDIDLEMPSNGVVLHYDSKKRVSDGRGSPSTSTTEEEVLSISSRSSSSSTSSTSSIPPNSIHFSMKYLRDSVKRLLMKHVIADVTDTTSGCSTQKKKQHLIPTAIMNQKIDDDEEEMLCFGLISKRLIILILLVIMLVEILATIVVGIYMLIR